MKSLAARKMGLGPRPVGTSTYDMQASITVSVLAAQALAENTNGRVPYDDKQMGPELFAPPVCVDHGINR
jgi:hypothetical protein